MVPQTNSNSSFLQKFTAHISSLSFCKNIKIEEYKQNQEEVLELENRWLPSGIKTMLNCNAAKRKHIKPYKQFQTH